MRSDRVEVFNLALQSDFTLFMPLKPLSHSAVDAGIVRIRSIRPRTFGNWSLCDRFKAFHDVDFSFFSQSAFE